MKLILPIGMMCLAIFMLASWTLLLVFFNPRGGMAEFLPWLAQSGPIDWIFMAIGAGVITVIIWGVVVYPLFFLHPKDWMEYWERHQG